VDLQGYRIGDSNIKMLGEGLSRNNYISRLNLRGNRISQDGAANLVQNLSTEIEHIDLSDNKIGKQGT
jgi:Ran GTPase-activating protein (RanGAP) involved in mRNA processing and transport